VTNKKLYKDTFLFYFFSYVYLWADGEKIKKPVECSAPKYIDYLLNWIQNLLDNDSIFPSCAEQQFPKNYHSIISDIFRKLLR
jgi:MOB kinase activator 1